MSPQLVNPVINPVINPTLPNDAVVVIPTFQLHFSVWASNVPETTWTWAQLWLHNTETLEDYYGTDSGSGSIYFTDVPEGNYAVRFAGVCNYNGHQYLWEIASITVNASNTGGTAPMTDVTPPSVQSAYVEVTSPSDCSWSWSYLMIYGPNSASSIGSSSSSGTIWFNNVPKASDCYLSISGHNDDDGLDYYYSGAIDTTGLQEYGLISTAIMQQSG